MRTTNGVSTPRDVTRTLNASARLRPMRSEDLPEVKSLLVDLPRNYPDANLWLARRLQDCIASTARCTVATVGEALVGVTILTPKARATKLSTIFVHPSFRDLGVGSRLLDNVLSDFETWAPRHARGELYVTVAEHTWPDLERLLASRGFIPTALERDRYGEGRHEVVAVRVG